jgi:hypothetical protein
MLYHNANLLLLNPLDFAFVSLGLSFLKKRPVRKNMWRLFISAHFLALAVLVLGFFTKLNPQNVSNVVYFLAPVAVLFFSLAVTSITLGSRRMR